MVSDPLPPSLLSRLLAVQARLARFLALLLGARQAPRQHARKAARQIGLVLHPQRTARKRPLVGLASRQGIAIPAVLPRLSNARCQTSMLSYLLLATCHRLLTARYALLTTDNSQLHTAHFSLLPTPYSLLLTPYSRLTTHYSPLTIHHSPLTTHYSLLT